MFSGGQFYFLIVADIAQMDREILFRQISSVRSRYRTSTVTEKRPRDRKNVSEET